jgi:predicted ester cyclase
VGTNYPRGHGGTEDVEVRDKSHLTSFSNNGEYSSNTLSERRGWLLRASATPTNGRVLRVLGMSRIAPRSPSSTTSMNKAPADVPESSGWHHEWCRPGKETGVGKEEEAAVSSAEENKALVRRFLEELAKGNLDLIDELLSPDFVDRSLMPGQGPTREDFKRTIAEILDATPTTSFTIEEQIVEGDTVVTKYRQSFVMRGEVIGIPLPGRRKPK